MKKTTIANLVVVLVCLAIAGVMINLTQQYSPGQAEILIDGVKLLAWLGLGIFAPAITISVMIFQNSDVADTLNIKKFPKFLMMAVVFLLMVTLYPIMGSSLDKVITGNSDMNTTALWTIWGAAQYLTLLCIALLYRFF